MDLQISGSRRQFASGSLLVPSLPAWTALQSQILQWLSQILYAMYMKHSVLEKFALNQPSVYSQPTNESLWAGDETRLGSP